MTDQKILIVGCGPGGAGYLTGAAHAAVRSAKSVFGALRLFELFDETEVPHGARIPLEKFDAAGMEQIAHALKDGTVAVLVTGDPGCYSYARMILDYFGFGRCRVIAGISSVQAAFAAVGLPWQSARIVSVHGRDASVEYDDLKREQSIAVLGGGKDSAAWLCGCVAALRLTHDAWLCRDVTLASETVLPVDESLLQEQQPDAIGEASAFAQYRTILLFYQKQVGRDSGSDSCHAKDSGKGMI